MNKTYGCFFGWNMGKVGKVWKRGETWGKWGKCMGKVGKGVETWETCGSYGKGKNDCN